MVKCQVSAPLNRITVSDVRVRTLFDAKNLHQSGLLKQGLNLPSLYTPVHLGAATRSYSIIARVYEALSTISTLANLVADLTSLQLVGYIVHVILAN